MRDREKGLADGGGQQVDSTVNSVHVDSFLCFAVLGAVSASGTEPKTCLTRFLTDSIDSLVAGKHSNLPMPSTAVHSTARHVFPTLLADCKLLLPIGASVGLYSFPSEHHLGSIIHYGHFGFDRATHVLYLIAEPMEQLHRAKKTVSKWGRASDRMPDTANCSVHSCTMHPSTHMAHCKFADRPSGTCKLANNSINFIETFLLCRCHFGAYLSVGAVLCRDSQCTFHLPFLLTIGVCQCSDIER